MRSYILSYAFLWSFGQTSRGKASNVLHERMPYLTRSCPHPTHPNTNYGSTTTTISTTATIFTTMTSSTSNPAAASSYTAPSAPRARRSSLPTTKELLAGLDMFLHLCAPPGKYRLVRILGFYYIMTRIFLTFVATLLVRKKEG